ncbi:Hypothetical predicted protein [Lecanosticta acicola]|uniref:Uncharacterized protein n=1 Tax=Lecanosticta acicola TaxID=111012 RepID=A0AAI8Z9S4_9PEZI|nr:Hypothetical predicted protein [Lecanosticta acicola]
MTDGASSVRDATSSLALLLPHFSSPEDTPSPTSQPDAPTSRTANELIRISRSFEDVIQSGSDETLAEMTERHIHPHFCARFDTAFIGSWEEYVRVLRIWVGSNPAYQKSIVATACNVEEEEREAAVYILIEVTGWPVQLKRLVVSVLKWRKRKRKWLCYENSTMRGIDTFATAE